LHVLHIRLYGFTILFLNDFHPSLLHPIDKYLLTSKQNPCLLDIIIPEALEKAERLDRQNQNNMPKGVLHGLPISLKDQFHIKGSDTTMGYVGWIDTFEGDGESERVGKVDSEIVAQLESMGAVVFCKVWIQFSATFMTSAINLFATWIDQSCGGHSEFVAYGNLLTVGVDKSTANTTGKQKAVQ
jgi:hypothetical protein